MRTSNRNGPFFALAGVLAAAAAVSSLAGQDFTVGLSLTGQDLARVTWDGLGGVNYELQQSPDLTFTNSAASRYFLGRGAALPVDVALAGQKSGFWRVRAMDQASGVCVATAGPLAGKLVRYDAAGTAVPLRAFGVNYYDAFLRYLSNSNDTSFIQGFDFLNAHHIPVVRVLAAGFWPKDWGLYFANKTEYYRRLDTLVEQAEQHNVGLILDLFWTATTVGELVDDAVSAGYLMPGTDFVPSAPLNVDYLGQPTYAEYRRGLGRSDSGSNALISYYTREVVSRYARSPAVWGWEFGNEYNLAVDLPNIATQRPTRSPALGQNLPAEGSGVAAWSGQEDITRDDVRVAKQIFAATVRSIDAWRLIMSGDSTPRQSAYSNWKAHTWTVNSRADLAKVIPMDNPAPMDTVTLHHYPEKPGAAAVVYFSDGPVTNQWLTGQYQERLDYFLTNSAALPRPLIVGEWGAIGDGTTADEKTTFNRMLQALIDARVQLSLMWTFDTRNIGMTNQWWIQTGQVSGYPASPKLYTVTNDDPDLWDLEQANQTYGTW